MLKVETTVMKKVKIMNQKHSKIQSKMSPVIENFPREFHQSFSHSYIHLTKLFKCFISEATQISKNWSKYI